MNQEHNQPLAALQTAIQMEIDGKKCYLQLSKTGTDEAGCKLFAALAEEEDIHLKKFEQIFRALDSGHIWPDVTLGDSQAATSVGIFTQTPAGHKGSISSELKSIQKAMTMENQTLDYYLEQAGKSTQPLEKQFYQAVAAQERVHHALLLDYFEYLKDPAQWFTMKEHQSLDGG